MIQYELKRNTTATIMGCYESKSPRLHLVLYTVVVSTIFARCCVRLLLMPNGSAQAKKGVGKIHNIDIQCVCAFNRKTIKFKNYIPYAMCNCVCGRVVFMNTLVSPSIRARISGMFVVYFYIFNVIVSY